MSKQDLPRTAQPRSDENYGARSVLVALVSLENSSGPRTLTENGPVVTLR